MPITKQDIDRLLKQIEEQIEDKRSELNRYSHSFNGVNSDLLEISKQLDDLIAREMNLRKTINK